MHHATRVKHALSGLVLMAHGGMDAGIDNTFRMSHWAVIFLRFEWDNHVINH